MVSKGIRIQGYLVERLAWVIRVSPYRRVTNFLLVRAEVRLRADTHLKGKEHEMVTHVDDRLTGKTVMVDKTKAKPEQAGVIVNSSRSSSTKPR